MQSLLNLEVFEDRGDSVKNKEVKNDEKLSLNEIKETLKTDNYVNAYKIIE